MFKLKCVTVIHSVLWVIAVLGRGSTNLDVLIAIFRMAMNSVWENLFMGGGITSMRESMCERVCVRVCEIER